MSTVILSITELTQLIKAHLDDAPSLRQVFIRGEISNFVRHTSRHLYFTLKDAGGKIKCVMFQGHAARLRFLPKDGMQVIACGNVSMYEKDGTVQFYVTELQPDGIGSLHLAYEQLKRRLEAEGLFDPRTKQAIPRFPNIVGVITSETGAVIRDIRTTLNRRFPAAKIVLFPVQVQGETAAPSIVRAIQVMNLLNEADVLIVGRGGGSLEELWAFNEEAVARAIFASRIPVISAVGHETDVTIADFVADQRAATPTAAAELCSPDEKELKRTLKQSRLRLETAVRSLLQFRKDRLLRYRKSSAFSEPKQRVYLLMERIDRMRDQLHNHLKNRIHFAGQKLSRISNQLTIHHPVQRIRLIRQQLQAGTNRLMQWSQTPVQQKKANLRSAIRALDALSPLKVMDRGYSLVYQPKSGNLLRSVTEIKKGDPLRLHLKDGMAECKVTRVEGNADE